jgi:hypothetical protein
MTLLGDNGTQITPKCNAPHNQGSKDLFVHMVHETNYTGSNVAATTNAKPKFIRSMPAKGTLNAFSKKHTKAQIANTSLSIKFSSQ